MSNSNPIFILSLPRSGSTYLQKLIMTSNEVHSISEPWILLPLLGAMDTESHKTIYGQSLYLNAWQDVLAELPNAKEDWNKHIRFYYNSIISDLNKDNKHYFLDKTPRYSIYAKNIVEIFPEAKIIVLTRNPVDIIASIVRSWFNNKWKISTFMVDFIRSNKAILSLDFEMKNILHVRYEDLININSKSETINNVSTFLNINIDQSLYEGMNLAGKYGDREAFRNNRETPVISNILRYNAVNEIINILSDDDLKKIGIERNEVLLKYQKSRFGFKFLLNDLFQIVKTMLRRQIIKNKTDYIYF